MDGEVSMDFAGFLILIHMGLTQNLRPERDPLYCAPIYCHGMAEVAKAPWQCLATLLAPKIWRSTGSTGTFGTLGLVRRGDLPRQFEVCKVCKALYSRKNGCSVLLCEYVVGNLPVQQALTSTQLRIRDMVREGASSAISSFQ